MEVIKSKKISMFEVLDYIYIVLELYIMKKY